MNFLPFVVIQNKVIIHIHSLSIYIQDWILIQATYFLAESLKHLQRQSYKTKLVSAMLNFHAKTEDFGLIRAVSRHS